MADPWYDNPAMAKRAKKLVEDAGKEFKPYVRRITPIVQAAEKGFASEAPKVVRRSLGGAVGGAVGGVLLDPSEAGANSDKVPEPSARQKKEMEARKKGGPVKKGKSYMVGEDGVEKFVPKEDGKIIPNMKLRKSHGARKGKTRKAGKNLRRSGYSEEMR